MQLIITTPHKQWQNTNLRMVLLTSLEGEMTILPDHEPMLLPFRIGLIQAINAHGERYFYFTQSGVGRITGNIVVLSTIECVPTKALSRTQIEKEIALSEKRSESVVERSEKETLHNDLQILQAKLEIIKRLQSHHST